MYTHTGTPAAPAPILPVERRLLSPLWISDALAGRRIAARIARAADRTQRNHADRRGMDV